MVCIVHAYLVHAVLPKEFVPRPDVVAGIGDTIELSTFGSLGVVTKTDLVTPEESCVFVHTVGRRSLYVLCKYVPVKLRFILDIYTYISFINVGTTLLGSFVLPVPKKTDNQQPTPTNKQSNKLNKKKNILLCYIFVRNLHSKKTRAN